MRKKIAKRLRRELLRCGCVIKKEQFVKEPGWYRRDCGYSIEFIEPDGAECLTLGFDMLDAYRLVLWGLKCHPEEPRFVE